MKIEEKNNMKNEFEHERNNKGKIYVVCFDNESKWNRLSCR